MSINPFTVLAGMSAATASITQNQQLALISQGLQKQLTRQLAALQPPVDQTSVNASQQQIAGLQKRQNIVSTRGTHFGNNGNQPAEMPSQVSKKAQAIANGDSTGFDNALSALNTNLNNVTPAAWNPLFQNDGITALKTNGIAIQSATSYDLSTGAGQGAATNDVTAVSALLRQILNTNSSNHTIAGGETTALNGKITALQSYQSRQQNAQSQKIAQQTQLLTQNMSNQLHLIQLNLGQTGQASAMLNAALNPPARAASVFGVLSSAVGQTAKGALTALGNPAIMSLFG